MAEITSETIDPRILRTRQLLQQALEKLLKRKAFDEISVQDIADAATVNRVTFYDHYTDKFALLECVVGSRFQELLQERKITFDGTCSSALKAIVLCVCDYLDRTLGSCSDGQRTMEPYLEAAVIAVVRKMLMGGLTQHPPGNSVPSEMTAATLSWAIYGAAREWARTPDRRPSEEIAGTIMTLISPMLDAIYPQHPPAH